MELAVCQPDINDSSDKPTNKTGRKRGGVWRYFREPTDQDRKSKRAECTFCDKSMVAQSDRMRSHIHHACREAPDNVKSELWKEEIASCSLPGNRMLRNEELAPIKLHRKLRRKRRSDEDNSGVSLLQVMKRSETNSDGESLLLHGHSPGELNQDCDERIKCEETKIRDRYDSFGNLVSNQIRSLPVDEGNKMMKRISEILFENY